MVQCCPPLSRHETRSFPPSSDSVAAVVAVKGALRRAKKRRALDRSAPLQSRAPLGRKSKNKRPHPPPAKRHPCFSCGALFQQKFCARMPQERRSSSQSTIAPPFRRLHCTTCEK